MNNPGKAENLFFNKNLQIVFLVTLMSVLGVASITPALPKIARHFEIATQDIGLLIIIFTLPGVFLTPLLGIAADRIGRKKVLIPSLLLFGIAGFACAFIQSFEILIVLRFLQGVGAASLGSLNVTIIGDLFEGRERAAAMGFNASFIGIATASYPFIGGILASIEWHYVFFLPVLAVPVALLVIVKMDNPEPRNKQTLKAYLVNALRSVKDKNALILFAASIVTFIILYGSYLTYLPILLDKNYSAKPFTIGIIMSVMSTVTAVVSSQLGRITGKIDTRRLLIFSFVFYGIALLLIPFTHSIPFLIFAVIIYGIGHGLNIPSIQTMLSGIAPLEYRAAFMSMNGMVLRLGQTLGPLIMGFMYVLGSQEMVFVGGACFAFVTVLPVAALKISNK